MSQNDRLDPVLKVFGVVAVTAAIVVLIIQLLKPKPLDQNSNPPKSGMGQPKQVISFSDPSGNWKSCHCEK